MYGPADVLAAIDRAGDGPAPHRLEGRSIVPLLTSATALADWRTTVYCDNDFTLRHARRKYVYFQQFASQLYDLEADPAEQCDFGRSPAVT
jgi:hypothetical protein